MEKRIYWRWSWAMAWAWATTRTKNKTAKEITAHPTTIGSTPTNEQIDGKLQKER